jgi:cytochrome c55X
MKLVSFLISVLVFSNTAIANDPSPQRQQELKNMLNHDCGSCHGLTLKGGLGPSLLPDALKNKTDDFLVQTILEGRKGTAMPPWKPFMTEQETLWLVKKLLKQGVIKSEVML